MENPPCAVCGVRESVVLIEAAGGSGPFRDYAPVCAVCSDKVGDAVPPELLQGRSQMKYTKDGDGFIVHDNTGRAICRVQTMTKEHVPEHKMKDGRILAADEIDKDLPREQWLFHFCAGRFTLQQLKDVIDGAPAAAVQP